MILYTVFKQLSFTLAFLTFSQKCYSIDSASTIENFKLKTCVQKKCIQLKSLKAQSGQLTTLFVLNNFDLEFSNSNEKFNGHFGYYDLINNRLNLKISNKQEMVIDLNTLEKRVYEL